MLKQFAGLALVATVFALPAVVVSPASAATIPGGDSLYAISCENDADDNGIADLFAVDADTAGLTYIGNSGLAGDCAGPAAFDPKTGTSYYLSWGSTGQLAVVNLTTGAAVGTPITGTSGSYPDALAFGLDGVAWVISGAQLFSIDLTTGITTAVASLTTSCLYSFSVDPTTGKFYVIQCSSGDAYELTVPSGALTLIGTIALTGGNTYAMQIDTSGRWWFQQNDPSLWSTPIPNDLVNPTIPEYEGDFYDSASDSLPYLESLLLTYPIAAAPAPAPALAATGADVVPGLVIAGSLVALGGVLAMASVKRRRRA